VRGLFGKKLPGMMGGYGGGTFEALGQTGEIDYTPQARAVMSGQAPMPEKRGGGIKDVLLGALGGAADGAATFFGGQPLIAQNRQMQQMMAMRQAEQERARSMDLADYRTKLGIQQEFAQPEAPKPGSFEWFQSATPEQRALYDQYNPVTVATGQGPIAVPRSTLGGVPSAPVGRLTPLGPTTQNTPAPQLGANGMPTTLSRQQYQAVVQSMGQAETDAWARRNNIRVVN
jgi:hypothetical protein